ncbi:hypothetical protein I7I48_04219 [Histoplasma ohiense]|nr:hypothetical protein I7I48_04219 [Histoplasma ohiense (nom. inval.)]
MIKFSPRPAENPKKRRVLEAKHLRACVVNPHSSSETRIARPFDHCTPNSVVELTVIWID